MNPRKKVPNEINLYFHCRRCMVGLASGTSPKEHQRIQVGWTPRGLQVWCVRHNVNIIHIDFQGAQHPAITTAFFVSSSGFEGSHEA